MAKSQRQLILEAIRTRLQAIAISAGYQTDAGDMVFLGEAPELGPDDPDVAVAIVAGDDDPAYQGAGLLIRLPIEIQAIATADRATPWEASEAALADVKTAMEQTDRTLGGLVRRQIERGPTRVIPRQAGSLTVGIAVTYIAPSYENWGAP